MIKCQDKSIPGSSVKNFRGYFYLDIFLKYGKSVNWFSV